MNLKKTYADMLVFDLDDTLHMRAAPFSRAVEEMFGITEDRQPADLFGNFRAIGVDYFHQWDAGTITEQEMYIRRTIDTFAVYGRTVTREEAARFHETYGKFLKQIRPAEGIEAMLQTAVELGAGLGILTNGSPVRQRGKIEALGLKRWIPEEHIAVSLELGVHKPNPEVFVRYRKMIYEKCGQHSGQSVSDSCRWWYVGDLYEHDIEPAARAGWHTIWMVHNEEDKTVTRDLEPDHIVRNGKELEEWIRKL